MPFKSLKQMRYFNANRAKMERQGVDVDEWNAASKGMGKGMMTSKRKGRTSKEDKKFITAMKGRH